MESLIRAAGRTGRYGPRDAAMLLVGYTHGMRASELVGLDWRQLDLTSKTVHVKRLKGSVSGTHPLRDREVKALRKLGSKRAGPVFASERGGRIAATGLRKIVQRAGRAAGLGDHVHPHMLRHSCGFRLTNTGVDLRIIQDWLGHKNISNTVLYTRLAAGRFAAARLWED